MRTVADGWATWSEHTLNPQTPRVKREPLLRIREGKGKEGKGKDRKGQEGKGRERKGKDGKGRERKGKEGKKRERKGKDGKGRERKGKKGKGKERISEIFKYPSKTPLALLTLSDLLVTS